jgi:hypothetical protein
MEGERLSGWWATLWGCNKNLIYLPKDFSLRIYNPPEAQQQQPYILHSLPPPVCRLRRHARGAELRRDCHARARRASY